MLMGRSPWDRGGEGRGEEEGDGKRMVGEEKGEGEEREIEEEERVDFLEMICLFCHVTAMLRQVMSSLLPSTPPPYVEADA